MRRRHLLASLIFLPAMCRAADPAQMVRGKLEKGPDDKPVLRTSDGKTRVSHRR